MNVRDQFESAADAADKPGRERFDNVPNFQTSDGTMRHPSDGQALDIRFVGGLSRVTLKPGDKMVLQYDRVLWREELERISAQLLEHFPGHKCIVIDGGGKLGVLSPEAA